MIDLISTHYATLPYLRLMYVAAISIPAALNTSSDATVYHLSSVVIHTLFPVIFLRNTIWVPSTILSIAPDTAHKSKPAVSDSTL